MVALNSFEKYMIYQNEKGKDFYNKEFCFADRASR
jgi:hypothetical protein